MSVSRGGLGAFDVAVLPEVIVPVEGHGLSSGDWLAPRRQLLRAMQKNGPLALCADLDGEYLNKLSARMYSSGSSGRDEETELLLLELLGELNERAYPRLTAAMPGTHNLSSRDGVQAALNEAHAKIEFDQIIDCKAAMIRAPVAVGGGAPRSIDEICDDIMALQNAGSVLRRNSDIVSAVLPMACRFSRVTLTGRYFGPFSAESRFVRELLSRLVALPSLGVRTFRCEFEGRTGRLGECPLSGSDLRAWAEREYGEAIAKAQERGVKVELVSWPEETGDELLDRYVVVGNADRYHTGLVISHVETRRRSSGGRGGSAGRTQITVLDDQTLLAWASEFVESRPHGHSASGEPAEVQAWPATR